MTKKIKNPTRGQIRYLLKKQNGRCAVSGEKLDPRKTSPDHIIPISRKEYSSEKNYGKIWLVSSNVNRMKSNLTVEEFYSTIEKIYNNREKTKNLYDEFNSINDLPEISKEEFDDFIKENFSDDGIIKK